MQVNFDKDASLELLWVKHAKCMEEFSKIEQETDQIAKLDREPFPEKSYFDLKLEIAGRIMENCRFCVRKCNVNRTKSTVGYCGCSNTMAVASIFEHIGEEPEFVPSGTIFTMGCTIRCRHCQNWTISQWAEENVKYTPQMVATEVERLRLNGCRNVNLVGGEPTPWLPQWLQIFKHVKVNVPVVWNSNSYYSLETARLLAGFADVYLLDFKYGSGDCAQRLADAPNYWETCIANHLAAKKYGELIIRVLVLPGHLDCCVQPILQWIAKNFTDIRVNLMFQYRPEWRAREIVELQRRLTKNEVEKAVRIAKKAGLKTF